MWFCFWEAGVSGGAAAIGKLATPDRLCDLDEYQKHLPYARGALMEEQLLAVKKADLTKLATATPVSMNVCFWRKADAGHSGAYGRS